MRLDPEPVPRRNRVAVLILASSMACLAWTSGYCFAAHDTPRMGLAEALVALETDLHPEHRNAMVAVVRDRIVQGIRVLKDTDGEVARAALAIVQEESR